MITGTLMLLRLPDEVLIVVFDNLQIPIPVCRRIHGLWVTHFLRTIDSRVLCRPPDGPCAARWGHMLIDRSVWQPTVNLANLVTLHLDVLQWADHQQPICRLLQSVSRVALRRLVLSMRATVPEPTLRSVCNQVACSLPALRCFEFRASQCNLSDAAFALLGRLLSELPQLARARIAVPMNSLTVLGLRRFMDGLHSDTLEDLDIDISGNWIRGADYGLEVARPAISLPALRKFSITFGGWGVHKRFGLEHLARLGCAQHLRSLSVRILGARITSDSLKRALSGLSQLRHLEHLTVDLATCDVGEQCHRALVTLRSAIPIRSLVLSLDTPGERILGVIASLRYMPSLETLRLILDWRMQAFTDTHRELVERIASGPHVQLCLRRARWMISADTKWPSHVELQTEDCLPF